MIPRYRAWGRDGNYPGTPSEKFEMFYDVSVVTTHQDKVQHVIADFGMYNESEYNGTEIIDYTLMQSTGLTDKNGKEIFEGDIIAIEVEDIEAPINAKVFCNNEIGVLMFHDFENNEDIPMVELLEDNSVAFAVVGNIWEHPELAEVKK